MTGWMFIAALVALQQPPAGDAFWNPRSAGGAIPVGEVPDADADADGRTYLADRTHAVVHVLDRELRPIGRIGRRGSRDGEYRSPHSVRVYERNRVAVLDQSLARIYVYGWVGRTPRLERTVHIPFEPHDFCPGPNGTFVVYGLYERKRLHELDSLGRVRRSGAPAPPLPRIHLNFVIDGRLACRQDLGLWLITSESLLEFEVFSGANVATLAPLRVDSIWPARSITIESDDDGKGFTFSSGPPGYHSPHRGVFMPGRFVVHAHVRGRGDRKVDDSVRVFAFSSKQPGVQQRWAMVGPLLALSDGGYLLRRRGRQPEFQRLSRLP